MYEYIKARKMVHWLRALATLPDDLSFVSRTHAGQLTTTCDSSSSG